MTADESDDADYANRPLGQIQGREQRARPRNRSGAAGLAAEAKREKAIEAFASLAERLDALAAQRPLWRGLVDRIRNVA